MRQQAPQHAGFWSQFPTNSGAMINTPRLYVPNGDNVARMARMEELAIDRQGRGVVPRSMRDVLGAIPGRLCISEVDGGLLLQPLPTGRDEWWRNLSHELDALTVLQVESLAEETLLLDETVGDGLS